MNLSPILPKTPVRTPQTGTSNKTLQLTPIWEAVVKSHRIPSDVNENSVFQEISSRLGDLEWPVRQHAFRVLYDIIPIISKDRLDERIIQHDILNKLTVNLGHPAPGVRKVAMETIRQYLKQTLYSEKMLESFVLYGVKDGGVTDTGDAGIIRENVILGTIMSLVDILKPFIFPENGGYAISQPFLNKIVAILSEKMKSPLYQEKCAETLWKIRDMVGENRFLRSLDHLPDKTVVELIRLRQTHDKLILDEAMSTYPKRPLIEHQDSDQSFEMELGNSITTYHNYKVLSKDKNSNVTDWLLNEKMNALEESTEDYSDGTDTDTYTKETVADKINLGESPASFIPIEEQLCALQGKEENETAAEEVGKTKETLKVSVSDDNTSDSTPSSPRVVLETEIQFSEDRAIKMTIVEDEKDSAVKDNEIDLFPASTKSSRESSAERRFVTEDGDLIMKILHNSENEDFREEERKRTPRRVRFGGEVIKLRTPDSDETDLTTEVPGNAESQDAVSRPTTAHGKPDNRVRPEIKLTPPMNDSATSKVNKLVIHESKPINQSHIPLPIAPATKSPRSREASPSKRSARNNSKTQMVQKTKTDATSRNDEESVTSPESVSGDEPEDDVTTWKWSEFGLVPEQLISDLKDQSDWKVQYQALEELKVTLINPKVVDKIGKGADDAKLSSLFKCLLHKLPQSNNQQVTTLSISVVFQLIQTLPKEAVKRNLQDIVRGLCRYVGGCKNVNLKIESVQSLKMLFSLLEPSSVIDILLEYCLTSSSSKMRENSLLAIMYATMTFPSNLFNIEKILENVARASADSRRRVRHAALEAISILSQFCSSDVLTESIGRVAETLPCNVAKTGLISAVQARLSRRVLPTVSSEGLVLYSLQIPASRRFGAGGNPTGADVSWILSGTGSVSTGSARSRGQLNAAQRLDVMAPFSPTKWRNSSQSLSKCAEDKSNRKPEGENPWTKQKHRTETSSPRQSKQDNWKNHGNRIHRTPSTGNLSGRVREVSRFGSSSNLLDEKSHIPRIYPVEYMDPGGGGGGFRPEEMSWALVPVSSLEEQQLARIRSTQIWDEFGIENGGQLISSPLGTLRPLYLKLQPTSEHLPLSRSTDDVRRSSFSYAAHRGPERYSNEDFAQIRVLTPSILREKNRNEDLDQNFSSAMTGRSDFQENEIGNRIPPLQSFSTSRNSQSKASDSQISERKLPDENHSKKNGGIVQNGVPEPTSPQGGLFPNIHGHSNGSTNHECGYLAQHKPSYPQYNQIDESKIQATMSQLDGLLSSSKVYAKSALTNRSGDAQPFASGRNQTVENETVLPLRNASEKKSKDFLINNSVSSDQNKFYDLKQIQSNQNTVTSAPALVNGNGRDHAPSTSSSNSTEFGVSSSSGIRLQRLKNSTGAFDKNGNRSLTAGYNSKLKSNKSAISKNNKISHSGSPFPENLKPFDRPKEGLDTCFSQLESQQWEVVMLGLTSLVRLLRHHPAIVLSQIHPLIIALGRQIRNLRSQVSRAACQAAAEMFVALKRNIEIDLEELAGPLFHRSADTNRFIRLDCDHALDNMTDNVSPAKAINVIVSKGSMHQNAVVRTVAARLLLRLSEKIGPEKILSLPRETRDKVVQTGANLLMEGKLETRAYAKELFRVWSSHPSFSNLMLEAIPPNVMRHISKTLISLKT